MRHVRVAVVLWALCGCGSTPPPPQPQVTCGAPIILGALGRSGVDAVVRAKLSALQPIYAVELAANPALAGEVVVRFSVQEDGSVTNARLKSSTLDNGPCEAAAIELFTNTRFPSPPKGRAVLTYPLVFSPG
ncbi:MAG: TonB family protein [Myxococcota bacterium]|jgi:TonB family protein